MPTMVIPLTLLGLAPFIVLGLAAVGNMPQSAEVALVALIDYAALVLAFAGGVHWGLALLPGTVRPALRIGLGVLPLLVGWGGVVLVQAVAPTVALCVLIAGYLASILIEHRAAQKFLLPSRYVWLRWLFSVVAMAMMVIVLVFRAFGHTIVL